MPGLSPLGAAIALYLAAINLLAFAAMALDKAKARASRRRIPEAMLLQLALIGGSPGTLVAQQVLRHKTRKEPFRSRLLAILAFHLLVLVALALALRLGSA
ncbi:DUF1294 domain-containing protein [Aureimonas sp. AU20]|uniref:DUF1294 domain-containing protein n=1 Tax=Aureimonas sp. AU20 TaxID=1349819 RepID=UPI00072131C2|nr:DUF1294 domain-containing protein [Aureimonas sp. AU20]ALN75620.1 hypothetical protein M673_23020 [Aureimonas sp. AU20]